MKVNNMNRQEKLAYIVGRREELNVEKRLSNIFMIIGAIGSITLALPAVRQFTGIDTDTQSVQDLMTLIGAGFSAGMFSMAGIKRATVHDSLKRLEEEERGIKHFQERENRFRY